MHDSYQIKTKALLPYYDLLVDQNRNLFFYDAIKDAVKDKIVLDLGTGSGILSHYALTSEAKFVYAVDQNSNIALLANQILKNSFPDKKNYKIINANFWTESFYNSLTKDIDVLISETIGYALFDEGMIKTWSFLKRHLNKQIISIPDRLSVDLYFYDNINNIDFVNEPSNTRNPAPTEFNLTSNDVIDLKFFNSLSKVDTMIFDNYVSKNKIACKYAWIKSPPDSKIENIFSYSYNDLPDLDENLDPIIETEIIVEKPCTLVLNNKFEYKNKIYNLSSSKKQGWRFNPCFFVIKAGRYKLKFDQNIKNNPNVFWTLQNID